MTTPPPRELQDILHACPPGLAVLPIVYQQDLCVQPGKILTTAQVAKPPTSIEWSQPGLYTLLFIDPDAPSRQDPTYRHICHWIVVNLQGPFKGPIPDGISPDKPSQEVLRSYIGSKPPPGGGFHRYIYLLYKQDKPIKAEPLVQYLNMDYQAWLKGVGIDPETSLVAYNYYEAEHGSPSDENKPSGQKD